MVDDFKHRLLSEEIDLHEKVGKLAEFLLLGKDKGLPNGQRVLLKLQLEAMQIYLHALQARIELIEQENF